MTDLHLLIERYKKNITQLEAQIADLRRKLDVVTEASRLLEEEGLLAPAADTSDYASCCNLSGPEEPFIRNRG
ncbi:MAG TPA: hypothetical protein VMT71_04325 [Syntrophorhabdales bacterium]|nr:hypothetical protein [Syntrophorhabdales bacterium]